MVIGLSQGVYVGALHVPFVRTVSLGNPAHEYICISLQIDDQCGLGYLFGQDIVQLLVNFPFISVQVQLGKEPVLGKHIVGDDRAFVEHARNTLLLPVAAEQEEHLGLKGILGARCVEFGEEGVLLKDLKKEIGLEMVAEHAGQCRLADANGSLDDDVPESGHGLLRQSRLPVILGYPAHGPHSPGVGQSGAGPPALYCKSKGLANGSPQNVPLKRRKMLRCLGYKAIRTVWVRVVILLTVLGGRWCTI